MSNSAASAPGPRFSGAALFDAFLDSPFGGLAPWILMALLAGPGRFEPAVAAAFGLSLLLVGVRRRRRGTGLKSLEVFDVAYFGALAVIGLFAGAAQTSWLELWSGEMSNIALAVFAGISVLVRRPFTLAYAREQTPREYWDKPYFYRVNEVITLVWTAAFGLSAVVGLIGNLVFRTANEFWTGWIVQIGAIVFAVTFTAWYSERAPALAVAAAGGPAEPIPPVSRLFEWVPVFVIATGVAGLLTDSIPTVPGGIAIAAGAVAAAGFNKVFPERVAQPGAPAT